MSRLIDADELMEHVYRDKLDSRELIAEMVKNAPTIEKRKTGHWKHVDPITEVMSPKGWMPWYCSECGCGVGKHQTAFCPNCGCDMRGEQDE